MIRALFTAFCLALVMSVSAPSVFAQTSQGGDRVWGFTSDDAEMNAAIEEGRKYLPEFLAVLREAGTSDGLMVKVALDATGGGQEHIWVSDLRFEGDQLKGALANAPNQLGSLRQGSVISIDRARISDWSIATREGMFGNFTTRVMLPRLEAAQRADVAAMLTRDPVPPAWRK